VSSAIEHAKPGTTDLRTLAAYVEALGGRLEIIADFGDQRLAFIDPAPKRPDLISTRDLSGFARSRRAGKILRDTTEQADTSAHNIHFGVGPSRTTTCGRDPANPAVNTAGILADQLPTPPFWNLQASTLGTAFI
jgi:hypothetical protein